MIQEIGNRRSIRKYKEDKISKKLLEEIIYSATLAPSAKNRRSTIKSMTIFYQFLRTSTFSFSISTFRS